MSAPGSSADDVLAEPLRARLVRELAGLARPASTQELSTLVKRHPNTVRLNLQRLADAGVIERRTHRQPRGRPRDLWAVGAGAVVPSHGYGDLARWLARVLRAPGGLDAVERTGRDIGRELTPDTSATAPPLQDTLTAMGFAPRLEEPEADRLRYVLGNCPYREAVRVNQPVVCALHKGITLGLLDRAAPGGRLDAFVARDPDTAGCLIEVTRAG